MKRIRALFTLLNLHIAGLAAILAVDIFLGFSVVLAMRAIHADQSSTFTAEEIHYGQLETRMHQIHDLPAKVTQARHQAAQFVQKRFAPNYSTIAAQLGDLAAQDHVRLANAQLTPTPKIDGITQVRIDASLSGQYEPLMHFINDIERDKHHVFFVIRGLAFNGQQGGLVNLRIRIDTYLQPGASTPPASSTTSAGSSSSGTSGQGSDGSNTTARLTSPLPQSSLREVR